MPINLQPAFTVNIGGTGTSEAYQFNSEGMVEIVPTSEGYDGMLRVTVNALNNKWLKPNGKVPEANVVNDTTFNVKEYTTMDAPHQVFTDKDIIERQTRFANLQRVEIPAGTTRMTPLFRAHSKLQEVILPPSCTDIMSQSFSNCRKLEKINLDNVSIIEDNAFYYCELLNNVTLSNSLTVLKGDAFSYCKSLESITIPDSITEIPHGCFNNDLKLKEVNLPNTLSKISSSAFSYCNELKNINLPSSLVNLETSAFSGSGLESLTIPASVTEISSNLCKDCKSLKSIVFESGTIITNLNNNAFDGCIELETITLPETIKYMSSDIFRNCNKLAEITIPANWGNNSLGSGVFSIKNGQPDVPFTLTILKSNGIVKLSYGVTGTNGTFTNRTINKIRVPADLVAAYKADSKWSAIADKIEAI